MTTVLISVAAPSRSADLGSVVAADYKSCTAFVDVTIAPMDKPGQIAHRTVLVEGGRIRSVEPAGEARVLDICRRIDGHDRFLIPGLMDTHVHFFGYTRAGAGDPAVERRVQAMLLANGVTTALVMEGTPELLRLREDTAAGRVAGPTLYVAGPLLQMSGSGELPGRPTIDTPGQAKAEVLAEKRLGYDFVKVHGDLPAETYAELLKTARAEGLRVVGHVPPNLGIGAPLDGGQVMIAHAESYLDGYFRFRRQPPSDPAEIDRMIKQISARTAARGVWVQPTLSVFRQIGDQVGDVDAFLQRPQMRYLPASVAADWRANNYLKRWTVGDIAGLRFQYAVFQRLTKGLHDAGVPLLAGTDDMVPMQLPGFSLKDELEQLAASGLTPWEALQAATANPARFLGARDKGTIAPGQVADLVLVNADPLEDVDNAFRQDGVMLRGRWFSEAELMASLQTSVP